MSYNNGCSNYDVKLLQEKIKALKEKNISLCRQLKPDNKILHIDKITGIEKLKSDILNEEEISAVENCYKIAVKLTERHLRLRRERKLKKQKTKLAEERNLFEFSKSKVVDKAQSVNSANVAMDSLSSSKGDTSTNKRLQFHPRCTEDTEVVIITDNNISFPVELDKAQKSKHRKQNSKIRYYVAQNSASVESHGNKTQSKILPGSLPENINKKQSVKQMNVPPSILKNNSAVSSTKGEKNRILNDSLSFSRALPKSNYSKWAKSQHCNKSLKICDVVKLTEESSDDVIFLKDSHCNKETMKKSNSREYNKLLNRSKSKSKLFNEVSISDHEIECDEVVCYQKQLQNANCYEDVVVVIEPNENSVNKSVKVNCRESLNMSKSKRKISDKVAVISDHKIKCDEVVYNKKRLQSANFQKDEVVVIEPNEKVVNKSAVNYKKSLNRLRNKRKHFDEVSITSDQEIECEEVSYNSMTSNNSSNTADAIIFIDDENHSSKSNDLISSTGNLNFDLIEESCENSECGALKNCIDISNSENDFENFEEIILPSLDLTEEPVDFPVPRLHANESLKVTKDEIKSLKNEGIVIRSGKFTKGEIKLLKRNFKDFQSLFGIEDARLLLGIASQFPPYKNERAKIQKFLKSKHFYIRLGKDINERTLYSIYCKARLLFNPLQKRKATLKDLPRLLQLQKKHGNNWTLIGLKMGLLPKYCEFFANYNKKCIAKGGWTEVEKKQLISAVKNTAKKSNLTFQNLQGMSWREVAKFVPTRNAVQCQNEWQNCLSRKIKNVQYPRWSKLHSAKLIYLLKKKFVVHDECDLNWEEIFQYFKNVTHSNSALRHTWSKIKGAAPKSLKKNYSSLIDYLYKKYNKHITKLNLKQLV